MALFTQSAERIGSRRIRIALSLLVFLGAARGAHAEDALPAELIVSDSQVHLHGLPNHSYIYNPSLVALGTGSLMVFRIDDTDGQGSTRIGAVELDGNFAQVGNVSLLDLRLPTMPNHTAEDPRLLWYDGQIYMVFNMTQHAGFGAPRALHLARLALEAQADGSFNITAPMHVGLRVPAGRMQQVTEKNWTPFVHDESIHIIYTTNPPDVMRIPSAALEGKMPSVELEPVSQTAPKIYWPHGEMRGGSPALYDAENNVFAAFFHGKYVEQLGWLEKHSLTIGFYTFEAEPPFAINRVIKGPVLPDNFHASDTATLSCAYPGGFIRRGETTFLVYGYQDKSIHVMAFCTQALWDFLAAAQPS